MLRGPALEEWLAQPAFVRSLSLLRAHMLAAGYARWTTRAYALAGAHVLAATGRTVATCIRRYGSLKAFAKKHLSEGCCGRPGHKPALMPAAGLLQKVLVKEGLVRLPAPRPALPIESLIEQCVEYCVATRGIVPQSAYRLARVLRRVLVPRLARSRLGKGTFTPLQAEEWVRSVSRSISPHSGMMFASALRSLLRFLAARKVVPPDAWTWVLSPKCRRARPYPLTRVQERRFLSSFDVRDRTQDRDYAMALCVRRLGMRAGEVAGLELDDIDVESEEVHLRNTKGRRTDSLPLEPEVATAIAHYLKHGRPKTSCSRVFVRHEFPWGMPVASSCVSKRMHAAFERAGLRLPHAGAHVLRHTLGTRLVEGGASSTEAGEMLRHLGRDTVSSYVGLGPRTLRKVQSPWPIRERSDPIRK